ncbi:WD40 repeat-like protein [Peniophora sp. CONT]|nr:WD40 repeat-like protein [Peniophora sp. CONT]
MPDISVSSQIFDLAFHPTSSVVYTAHLTGSIHSFAYDDATGESTPGFTLRPTKRSVRALALSPDGGKLYAAGKAKAIHTIDTTTGSITSTLPSAHNAPINRMLHCTPQLLATGDDDGVIKLWDPRALSAESKPTREYTHHFDFVSDLLWLDDKKQLVATSGDGTLSVMDVRSKKTEPFAQSEDQEDELLSILPIRGASKFVVGTQLGVLSIFSRHKGWGDCVDRIPGHPHSVDALCSLPSSYPSSSNTLLTGSSDGLLRVVELFPTKLVGVVADHGDWPIERIKVDRAGEGRWVGSVGHEDVLRMTDLREVFEDEDGEEGDADAKEEESEDEEVAERDEQFASPRRKVIAPSALDADSSDSESDSDDEAAPATTIVVDPASDSDDDGDEGDEPVEPTEEEAQAYADSDSDEGVKEKEKKRKKKDKLSGRPAKKGRNDVGAVDKGFFSGL